MLFRFINLNLYRTYNLFKLFYNNSNINRYITNLKIKLNNLRIKIKKKNIRKNIYFILFRLSLTLIILPLPISFSFYYIVIKYKFHFPHIMAIIIVIIVSCIIHLTIGYALLIMDLFIEMDRNKKFKDYLYPIYEKNIVILNIIN
jgi:hypothetical protein